MSDAQLRAEVMTVFLAGQETTAIALGWTWYLLSRHEAVRQRLHTEIDAVLGGRTPTVADLPPGDPVGTSPSITLRPATPVTMHVSPR